ncbi:hypothetical protein [Clostridium sp. SHJSY1]|nr:hypothetical protein [Clostridium sp. SHJSY1]
MLENESKKKMIINKKTNSGTSNERAMDGDEHKPTKGIPRVEK